MMDKIIKNFDKYINSLFKIISLFIFLFYTFCVIIKNYLLVKYSVLIYSIFVAFLIIFGSFFFSDKIKKKCKLLLLFVLSMFVINIWNYFVKPYPTSDYEVIWNGAKEIINNTFYLSASSKDNYFYFYNFQIGYTYYISLIMRIFGENLQGIYFIKSIVISVTIVILYKTLILFVDEKAAFFSCLIASVFPCFFVGSGIINNQHEGLLCVALAVFLFFRIEKQYKYVLCGVVLSIGNILRPTEIIVMLVLFVVCIYFGITNKKKDYFIGAIILIISYFIVTKIVNYIFIITQIAPIGIESNNLWFKLVLGLTGNGVTKTTTTSAEKTNYYYDLLYYNFSYDRYNKAAKEYLLIVLSDFKTVIKNVISKYTSFAGTFDNQYCYANSKILDDNEVYVFIINLFGHFIYFISIIFSAVVVFFKNKITKNKFLFIPVLLFCSYAVVYILFEAQTRYRYEQYYFLFLIGMPYCYKFLNTIKNKVIKLRLKNKKH